MSTKRHLVKNWDEPYNVLDHEFTPSERIQENIDYITSFESEIDPERAMIITESYKETENEPIMIRRAKAFLKTVSEKTIYIKPNELIVGNLAFKPLSSMIYPEYSYKWVIDEMENHPFDQRDLEPYQITEDTKEKLRSIKDYWFDSTLCDRSLSLFPEEVRKARGINLFDVGNYLTGGIGHFTCNYDKVISRGFESIKEEIIDRKKNLSKADVDYPELC